MAKSNKLNLAITVNGQEVDTTLTNINRSFFKLRNSVNKLEEGTDEWIRANKELAKFEKERERQIKVQREFREEIKKTIDAQEKSGEVLSSFGENMAFAFAALKSGDMVAFQSAWKGVTENIGQARKAAVAFIATPIGATIAAIAAIGFAAKEWAEYNKEAAEGNRITQQITGLTGDVLSDTRVRAKALEDTFGTDFKQNLEVAKKLVEGFGVTYDEAFDIITEGFIRGGKENDEFIKSLNEYPKLFAQAGFTIQEFQKIVNTGIDLGVYDDKLPDAIKEFSLSVMEQTDNSRKALESAFGKEFTTTLFKNIENGSISTKEALIQVSNQAQNVGVNVKDAQVLTADLFRGAGEDAGGALLIFEAVNKALVQEQRELTELEKLLQRQATETENLETAQKDALESNSWAKMEADANSAWTLIQTGFFKGITFITNRLDDLTKFLTKTIVVGINLFREFPTSIKSSLIEVRNDIIDVIKTFGQLGTVVSKILTLDYSGAATAAAKFKTSLTKEFNDVRNSASSVVDEVKNIIKASNDAVNVKFEEQKKAAGDASRLEEEKEKQKKQAAELAKLTEQQRKAAIAEEKKRLDALEALQKEYQKRKEDREANTALKKIELDRERALKSAEALKAEQQLIDQINAEYNAKKEAVELQNLQDFQAKKQKLIDDIALQKAESDEEKELIAEEQRYEKELEKFQKELEFLELTKTEKYEYLELLKQSHEDRLLDIETRANEKRAKENKKIYDELIQAELNLQLAKDRALSQGVNILQGFFDETSGIYKALFVLEKSLQIGQIVSNAAKGIATAQANHAAVPPFIGTFPNPVWPLSLAAMTKNITATKLSAASQIAAIASQNLKGFYLGGYTDSNKIGKKDAEGREIAGFVHKNEYVVPEFVRRDPEVPNILNYLETKRKQKLGIETSASTKNTVASSPSKGSNLLESTLVRLAQRLEQPIVAETYYDQEAELRRQEVQKKTEKLRQATKIE